MELPLDIFDVYTFLTFVYKQTKISTKQSMSNVAEMAILIKVGEGNLC